MKAKCELIRDLLPLYHDGVCSDVSKEIVEEHVKTCEACKEELHLMEEAFLTSFIQVEETEVVKAAVSTWKKGKRKSILKGGFVALFLVLALLVAYVGTHFLSTANGTDFNGLRKQAVKYFDGKEMVVEATTTGGNYLVALYKDEDSNRYLCVYEEDEVLDNRWNAIAGEKIGKDGRLNHRVFSGMEDEELVVVYGFNLPNEMHVYSCRTDKNIYYSYGEGKYMLEIFITSKNTGGIWVSPHVEN